MPSSLSKVVDVLFTEFEIPGAIILAITAFINITMPSQYLIVNPIIITVFVAVFLWKRVPSLIQTQHYPVVMYLGSKEDAYSNFDQNVLRSMDTWGYKFSRRSLVIRLNPDRELLVQTPGLTSEKEDWFDLLDEFYETVKRVKAVESKKVIHVFVRGPTALALGVGAVIGLSTPVKVWQHEESLNSSHTPLLDLTTNPRGKLRDPPKVPPTNVKILIEERSKETLFISISLTSHSTEAHVREEAARSNATLIAIESTGNVDLSPGADLAETIREIYAPILSRYNEGARTVRLYATMPVSLAVCLGIALGTTMPITVYHWFRDRGEYAPVYELNKLRVA